MTTILVGGDVCPTGAVAQAFAEGSSGKIFGDLLQEFLAASVSIINLECPLVSQSTPIPKAGPVLGASPDAIRGLSTSGIQVVNLANNHSFDHGEEGLQETLHLLRDSGLEPLGAGLNIREARKPVVRQVGGTRIVLYAMAEREFSIATEATAGANPLDLISFVHAVKEYKKDGVFVVLVHGGIEYHPYPTPQMVRRCRFIVDMGADAVICCHSHCPVPWETYRGRPIVYGLGNLIFEGRGRQDVSWYQGYLAKLQIEGKSVLFEPVPYTQSLGGVGARGMEPEARRRFLDLMIMRGGRLDDDDYIHEAWLDYCIKHRHTYLAGLFAYPRVFRALRRVVVPIIHSRQALLRSLLLVQCESHREVLNTLFQLERETSDERQA